SVVRRSRIPNGIIIPEYASQAGNRRRAWPSVANRWTSRLPVTRAPRRLTAQPTGPSSRRPPGRMHGAEPVERRPAGMPESGYVAGPVPEVGVSASLSAGLLLGWLMTARVGQRSGQRSRLRRAGRGSQAARVWSGWAGEPGSSRRYGDNDERWA